jgi:hypothetical protein
MQAAPLPPRLALVPIRPAGSRVPLFLVHGAKGNVLLYRQFSRYPIELTARTGQSNTGNTLKFSERDSVAILNGKSIGWGGRIRTFTIHINSVVSYRLDHAPAAFAADLQPEQTR